MSEQSLIARPHVTARINRAVATFLHDLGYAVIRELTLPDGSRVDFIGLDAEGRFAIVEVKSGPQDFRTDQKWQGYLAWADRFWFAVDEDFPRELLAPDVGLIVTDGFSGHIVRETALAGLHSARRRALTLLFARQAAWRAMSLQQPPG